MLSVLLEGIPYRVKQIILEYIVSDHEEKAAAILVNTRTMSAHDLLLQPSVELFFN